MVKRTQHEYPLHKPAHLMHTYVQYEQQPSLLGDICTLEHQH